MSQDVAQFILILRMLKQPIARDQFQRGQDFAGLHLAKGVAEEFAYIVLGGSKHCGIKMDLPRRSRKEVRFVWPTASAERAINA